MMDYLHGLSVEIWIDARFGEVKAVLAKNDHSYGTHENVHDILAFSQLFDLHIMDVTDY